MHSYEKIRYPFDHIKENSKKPLVPHLAKTKLSLKILAKPQLSEIIKLWASENLNKSYMHANHDSHSYMLGCNRLYKKEGEERMA